MVRIKYSGVLIDSTLSWKPHIVEVSKKLARTSGIFLQNIRHYVPFDTLKLLYYSLFYSFITYSISVWGLTHPSYLDPLYKLQKKIVRTILPSKINTPVPLPYFMNSNCSNSVTFIS